MSIKSKLNDAISKAHLALEEIDYFDLYSKDPKSVKEFNKLNKVHDRAVANVIRLAVKLHSSKTPVD